MAKVAGWGIVVALACSAVGYAARIEAGARYHLERAHSVLAAGKWDEAVAGARVVLTERLTYFVDLESAPPERRSRFYQLVKTGFDLWSEALEGAVVFEEVPASQAAITVRFEPHLTVGGRPVAGHCRWERGLQRRGGEFATWVRATIRLRTRMPWDAPIAEGALLQAALHEIGHVLGLDDGGSGVMGPVNPLRPVLRPSPEEVAALRDLHDQARLIIGSVNRSEAAQVP